MKTLSVIGIVIVVLISNCLNSLAQDSIKNQPLPIRKDSVKKDLNTIEAGIRHEGFNKNYRSRLFLYLQYGRKIKNVDVFVKMMHYTFGSLDGCQFESEAYWKFKKKGYAYFDAAYSDAIILPNYRLRAEVYQYAGNFECSFGAGVVKPFTFREIPLVTGTIGYYLGDYYIYARPTFSYVDNGITKSIFVQGRRYFSKTDFVAVSLLKGADTGTSRNLNAIINSFGIDTYLIRLSGQLKLGKYKLGAGLDNGGIFIPERGEYAKFFGFDVFINKSF